MVRAPPSTAEQLDDISVAFGVELKQAVRRNDLKSFRRLVAAGADLNLKGTDGATPLHDAAARGNVKIVRLLIGAGADVASRYSGTTHEIRHLQ